MSEFAITGIGLVSPIGIGLEPFWEALVGGKSGISRREPFTDTNSILGIGGRIQDFDGKKYVKPRKSIKVMCLPIQFGFAAANMAIENAEIDESHFPSERKGTVFGAEAFYANPLEVADVFHKCMVDRSYEHDRWGEYAMREIEPLWMLKYLPNMVASHVSISFDARGPSNSICQGEVSGSLSLIEGMDFLRRGTADVVVAGGTGSPMEYTDLVYRSVHRLAKNYDSPETACRPFDAGRSGLVLGEGSGSFVLERTSEAEKRGAKIIARVIATTRGFCPDRSEQNFSKTISKLIRRVLDEAGMNPADIGHINATGLGTGLEDRIEANGVTPVMGDCPVFAPKSYYGYIGPGSELVDLTASILAVKNKLLPKTMNFETVDPDAVSSIKTEPLTLENPVILSVGFAPTGQITCMIVDAS